MTSAIMRGAVGFALTLAAALGLSGCGESKKVAKVEAKLIQPDCYTVDPYQPIRIAEPKDGVPATSSAFLGAWGGGAWDGSVCHDLWVMEVDPKGGVLMFDAHGPGFFPDATAFTRKGQITPEGRLRVRKGRAVVEYFIQDGMLFGERTVGGRTSRIIMTRKS